MVSLVVSSVMELDLSFRLPKGMKEDGWKLKGDTSFPLGGELRLELVEVLQGNESYVAGNELKKHALSVKASQGQQCAETLLLHSDKIPEDWRPFILLFPGTVWESPGGDEFIPCLAWREEKWVLQWADLLTDRYAPHRFVRMVV